MRRIVTLWMPFIFSVTMAVQKRAASENIAALINKTEKAKTEAAIKNLVAFPNDSTFTVIKTAMDKTLYT